jgi:hypothetical protein
MVPLFYGFIYNQKNSAYCFCPGQAPFCLTQLTDPFKQVPAVIFLY